MELIVSTGEKIMKMNRDGGGLREVATVDATALDYDMASQTLYYINKTDKQVRICH